MKNILLKKALEVLNNSHSPYSSFKVAAALECADGSVITGVNVENSAFGSTICAEANAISSAVALGKKDFARILIIGGKDGNITDFCPPCGNCRQIMSEFCGKDFEIILFNGKEFETHTLDELIPGRFSI